MNKLKQRLISLTTVLALLCAMFTVPVSAAYENTHVNTGKNAFDVLNVALTQLGYKEGTNNETKYGAWYPMNYNPWCAMFVSWCAEQAGIPTSVIPKHASCDVGMNWFKNNSVWHDSAYYGGTYIPAPGDVIYFGVVGDSDHVGYVMSAGNGYVNTIEGNASDMVMQKSYALNSSKILGYGVPAYNQVVASGSCGSNVTWALSGTGVLHIAGSGAMTDYTDGGQPWLNYRGLVKEVQIYSGVTSIGNFAFCVMPNLTKLTIDGSTLTRIGVHAFSSGTSLTGVTLPDSVTTLDVAAFAGTALTDMTLSENVSSIGHAAFLNCSKLTNVTVLDPEAVIDENAFDGTAAGFTLTGYHSSTASAYAAANGHTFVSLNGEPETEAPETEAPETEAPETEAPETEAPETEAPDTAVFTLSAAEGVRGQTVAVEITLENTEVINSVALFDLTYSDALTFAGFADYEEIEDKSLFTGCYDEENRVISIALTESETLSGSLGKILFTVNDDASKGLYTIGMTSLVKLDDTVIPSEAVSGSVRVKNELLGDLDGSGAVNINDARILFRHSMLPEIYPITYSGDLDFTDDGVVDINDARRLFQYSMLPEIYPIG